MTRKLVISNLDNLIKRYVGGCSLKHLSDETSISRPVLLRRFKERGVKIRGRHAAQLERWRQTGTSPPVLTRVLSAAWQARRGSHDSRETKRKRALTNMANLRRLGKHERELAGALQHARIGQVIQQFAVGSYNLDFAVPAARIAVELVLRDAHQTMPSSASPKRLKDLLNLGWRVLFLCGRQFDLAAATNHVIAFSQRVGRLEPGVGQYRVIWSNGQAVTLRGLDPNDSARI